MLDQGYYDVDEFVDADDYEYEDSLEALGGKKEEPMFKLERASRPGPLHSVIVHNGMVIMAMQNGNILRLNTGAGQETPETIRIASSGSKRGRVKEGPVPIHKIFLDPNGIHLIICLTNKENYYISQSMSAPRFLSKLICLVESVAWDTQNVSDTSTGSILVGSGDGRIIEVAIEGAKERVVRTLFDLHNDTKFTGLRFERFPPSVSEPKKYFVMATTPTRLYEFIGGPTFEAMFDNYETNHQFKEVYGTLEHSSLHFWSKHGGLPTSFIWLTGQGVYHGNLIFGSQGPGDNVHRASPLIPYTEEGVERGEGGVITTRKVPLALGVTEFHYLALYKDMFQTISRINPEEESSTPCPIEMVGIAQDTAKNVTYVYSRDTVFVLVIKDEDRNVWEMYLEQGDYNRALEFCKTADQKDVILSAQADHFFEAGQYQLSAEHYGKTCKSFEEVCMKFIRAGRRDATRTYLVEKLAGMRLKEATQKTLICTWLTEMYLCSIDDAAKRGDRTGVETETTSFRTLLKEYKDHVDVSTTFNLLESHGSTSELLYFANLTEDYNRMMVYFIREGKWEQAIRVMNGQGDTTLYYGYSPLLMTRCPRLVVNAWATSRIPLNERKLIPSLMRYNKHTCNSKGDNVNYAIKWLEHTISKGNTDPVIHNYLVSLLASDKEDDKPLLSFLLARSTFFDLKYALRQCIKHRQQRALVHIYSSMGLHEEAVQLALNISPTLPGSTLHDKLLLAKQHADKPEDDDDLRKKLWLKIARHVVHHQKDIKTAMNFLKECELLKVEDILPFFPGFDTIDDFKQDICNSLTDYNRHIEELVGDMDDATQSANLIRLDVADLTNRYGVLPNNGKCAICGYPTFARQFYMFPCQHSFHCDCLVEEVTKHMNKDTLSQLRTVQERISIEQSQVMGGRSGPDKYEITDNTEDISIRKEEQLRETLDDLVASECPFCGERMIESIADPFVSIELDNMEIREWYV